MKIRIKNPMIGIPISGVDRFQNCIVDTLIPYINGNKVYFRYILKMNKKNKF